MLVDLRRMCTGPLVSTFPRYVESVHVEERSALVSTALPGVADERRLPPVAAHRAPIGASPPTSAGRTHG